MQGRLDAGEINQLKYEKRHDCLEKDVRLKK